MPQPQGRCQNTPFGVQRFAISTCTGGLSDLTHQIETFLASVYHSCTLTSGLRRRIYFYSAAAHVTHVVSAKAVRCYTLLCASAPSVGERVNQMHLSTRYQANREPRFSLL